MPLETTLAIDDFIRELERFSAAEFVAAATDFIQRHPLDRASLDKYAFFSERHYTRNLIFKNDLFEVLALCWWPGQQSSIHNHRDQTCWMAIGEGVLDNVNYKVHDRCPEKRTCRLEQTTTTFITREEPLAVDVNEPVHMIRNAEERGARAMSVHLYSRPFDTCEVYSPDLGTYQDVKLSYWSIHGKVLPPVR